MTLSGKLEILYLIVDIINVLVLQMFVGPGWTSEGFGFISLLSKDINAFSRSNNRLLVHQEFHDSYHKYGTHSHYENLKSAGALVLLICLTPMFPVSLLSRCHSSAVECLICSFPVPYWPRCSTKVIRCSHQSQGRFVRIHPSGLGFNISYLSVLEIFISGQVCFCF